MAGATLELDHRQASAAVNRALQELGSAQALLNEIGEYLLIAHDRRFAAQVSPEGEAWQALKPNYLKRKRKNKDKILQLDGYLANTLRYQSSDSELLFGTNRKYGAIHHFGGAIAIAARSQKSKLRGKAQTITLGAYTINMPARPWLGVSQEDAQGINALALDYLTRAFS